ncbi:MAG: hypothetical protein E5X35_07385 [Mesorhizobium sp.]|uniref:hypothetical protein n=1 Tax=Mesorhizobium sp. TaxID=1871066 RepID=UPI00121F4E10|nr:hypothetical protein [Mesorhizobium sp.]TIR34531.1 MAG: hypothetical protein E5X35_07385 [Mesorhizobium sp.]
MSRLTDAQLLELADDAFTVLNWAKRLGFNRERQLQEMVRTFEVRLGYRQATVSAPASSGANLLPIDVAARIATGGQS